MNLASRVRKHWVSCLITFVGIVSLALIALWVVGDLRFAEFLALLVGLISFPVGVVALRLATHTDRLLTAMANGQFTEKADSLKQQSKEINEGTLTAAKAMATDVKVLTMIASVADDSVKRQLMTDAVRPAIDKLNDSDLSRFPSELQKATEELESNAERWEV